MRKRSIDDNRRFKIPPPEETALWRFLKKKIDVMSVDQYELAKELLERRKNDKESKRGKLLEDSIKAYESPRFAEKYLDKERDKPLLEEKRTIERFKQILSGLPFDIKTEKDLWWAKQAFEFIKFQKNRFSISKSLKSSIEKYTGETLIHPLIVVPVKKERAVVTEKVDKPIFFPCVGKTAWDTKEQARLALQSIRHNNTTKGKGRSTMPLRSYQCNFCGKYHLTSKPFNYHLNK